MLKLKSTLGLIKQLKEMRNIKSHLSLNFGNMRECRNDKAPGVTRQKSMEKIKPKTLFYV